jgi:hypothetical protein
MDDPDAMVDLDDEHDDALDDALTEIGVPPAEREHWRENTSDDV